MITTHRDKCDIHGRGECKCNRINAVSLMTPKIFIWLSFGSSVPTQFRIIK